MLWFLTTKNTSKTNNTSGTSCRFYCVDLWCCYPSSFWMFRSPSWLKVRKRFHLKHHTRTAGDWPCDHKSLVCKRPIRDIWSNYTISSSMDLLHQTWHQSIPSWTTFTGAHFRFSLGAGGRFVFLSSPRSSARRLPLFASPPRAPSVREWGVPTSGPRKAHRASRPCGGAWLMWSRPRWSGKLGEGVLHKSGQDAWSSSASVHAALSASDSNIENNMDVAGCRKIIECIKQMFDWSHFRVQETNKSGHAPSRTCLGFCPRRMESSFPSLPRPWGPCGTDGIGAPCHSPGAEVKAQPWRMWGTSGASFWSC